MGRRASCCFTLQRRALEHKNDFDDEDEAGVATLGSVLVLWL
jgi:hypothetical protein